MMMRQTNKLKFSLVAYGGYGGIFVENHNHVNFTEWHLRYSSKRQTGKSPSTGRWTLTGGDVMLLRPPSPRGGKVTDPRASRLTEQARKRRILTMKYICEHVHITKPSRQGQGRQQESGGPLCVCVCVYTCE